MNPIILELLKNGISATVEYNPKTDKVEYIIDGFYKSGTVRVVEENDVLIAHSRYNNTERIRSLFDLVALNYNWWLDSRNKFDGWKDPDSRWLPLLLKEGYVKEETKTVTTYSSK